jgi:hypothetical protein
LQDLLNTCAQFIVRMNGRERAGLALVVLSGVAYMGLFAVPWLPLSLAGKSAAAVALVVGGEALFWLGVLIAGREIMRKYRHLLSPRQLKQELDRLTRPKPDNRSE